MKNKKVLSKKVSNEIAIGVILTIAVLIGGIFYLKSKKEYIVTVSVPENLQTQNQQSTVTGKNQAVAQKNVTLSSEFVKNTENISADNWKLFTNKKEGYSVKYPQTWLSSFVDGSSFFVKELRKNGKDYPSFGNILSDNLENLENVNGDYFINISVNPGVGNRIDLKEWRKYNGTNYQEVLINGYTALRFDEKPHAIHDDLNKDIAGIISYYFIDKKHDGYEITIWYKGNSNGFGDKIISTLNIAN